MKTTLVLDWKSWSQFLNALRQPVERDDRLVELFGRPKRIVG